MAVLIQESQRTGELVPHYPGQSELARAYLQK